MAFRINIIQGQSGKPECVLPIVTELSDVQQKAFNLLNIKPNQYVPMNVTG